MGGPATLLINHKPSTQPPFQSIVDRVMHRLSELEQRYSRYRSDSLITKINTLAGTDQYTPVDAETRALLDVCELLWRKSNGLFDPTSGILRQAWNFQGGSSVNEELIPQLLSKIGWQHLLIDQRGVLLQIPGMELDLGGLVKEYAADAAIALLRELDVDSALIELAGDVIALGSDLDGKPWQVGIRDPQVKHRNTDKSEFAILDQALTSLSTEWISGDYTATADDAYALIAARGDDPGVEHDSILNVALIDAALATSGNYERYIEMRGQTYSHLLNPQTGWPVQGAKSVSVIAQTCLTAGAIATVGCLHTPEDASIWLNDAEMPWLMIDQNQRLSGPLAAGILR